MRPVLSVLVQFAIGLVFGLGLVVAGMSNPAKVLNFLDVGGIPTGVWDPSLAFVMAGAIAVTFIGYRLVLRRPKTLFGGSFRLPGTTGIDPRVVVGPAIFGVGWGLVGFCPGPAFTALATGGGPAALFVVAMLAGMAGARWLANRQAAPTAALPRL
jgi:uncharacterized membrane protein YedE/YeeE